MECRFLVGSEVFAVVSMLKWTHPDGATLVDPLSAKAERGWEKEYVQIYKTDFNKVLTRVCQYVSS